MRQGWREALGFIAAPLSASLLMAIAMPAYDGLAWPARVVQSWALYSLFGALPLTLFVALPVYAMLRCTVRPSLGKVVASCALVVVVPLALLSLSHGVAEESVGGTALVIGGHRTLEGWLFLLRDLAEFALLGAVAGLVFWGIARPRPRTQP